jgi:hypothetical protein
VRRFPGTKQFCRSNLRSSLGKVITMDIFTDLSESTASAFIGTHIIFQAFVHVNISDTCMAVVSAVASAGLPVPPCLAWDPRCGR